MIINAKDKPINQSGLPQVGEVIVSWFQPLIFDVVTKIIEDYEVHEEIVQVVTQGVRQPMSAKQLAIKPEGQRAWSWETLHCLPNVKLKIDDIVIFDNTRYRVTERWDWTEYGYLEYHICQAYETQGGGGES